MSIVQGYRSNADFLRIRRDLEILELLLNHEEELTTPLGIRAFCNDWVRSAWISSSLKRWYEHRGWSHGTDGNGYELYMFDQSGQARLVYEWLVRTYAQRVRTVSDEINSNLQNRFPVKREDTA